MPSINQIVYPTPEYPRQLRLDTAGNNCNASCPSCHRYLSERSGWAYKELTKTIINDVATWDEPLNEIVPVNYGEFFLYKDWLWLLQLIAEKLPATRIVIPTNGTMLTKRNIKALCSIPNIDIINFSINAFFDETYEQFMGLPPKNMERIIEAMQQIASDRLDITLWASMVFDPAYQTDLERDLFTQYWNKTKLAYPQVLTASSAGREDNQPIHPLKIPCRSLFSDIVISYDGKLSSCCWDSNFSIYLGYYTGDLKKDWRNFEIEKIRKLHNEHRRDEIDLCKRCGFG